MAPGSAGQPCAGPGACVMASPVTSAHAGAPRRAAPSSDSTTTKYAPSPGTNPRRPLPKGPGKAAGSPRCVRRSRAQARSYSPTHSSAPPARATSQTPARTRPAAVAIAASPDASISLIVRFGPRRPRRIEHWLAGEVGTGKGKSSAQTRGAPPPGPLGRGPAGRDRLDQGPDPGAERTDGAATRDHHA